MVLELQSLTQDSKKFYENIIRIRFFSRIAKIKGLFLERLSPFSTYFHGLLDTEVMFQVYLLLRRKTHAFLRRKIVFFIFPGPLTLASP